MDKDESILAGRFLDLANKSYRQNIYTFTDFLSLSEQDLFFSMQKEFRGIEYLAFGGAKDCERVMLRFGDENSLGYTQDFPILCLKIIPKAEKFSEKLTHRDCLGAIMNLGIERGLIGDLVVREKEAFVFCKASISDYIIENLVKIRHTLVLAEVEKQSVEVCSNIEPAEIQVASERLDAIVSKVFGLSRDNSLGLFCEGKIYINGKNTTGNSTKPKDGDIISVRGHGRFRYVGQTRTTKKGKLAVAVEKFI